MKEVTDVQKTISTSTAKINKATESLAKLGEEIGATVEKHKNALVELEFKIQEKTEEYDELIKAEEAKLEGIRADDSNVREAAFKAHRDAIAQLKLDKENELRQAKIDFDLALKEHKEQALEAYLNETGRVSHNADYVSDLENDLENLRETFDNKLKSAVGAAIKAKEKEHEHALKIKDLEFDKIAADDKALIKQLKQENIFLKEQVDALHDQIDKERAAQVEMASAKSNTINVSGK